MIQQGRAKIYKLNPDGIELVLRIFGEGNTFNDIAALDGGPNPANAAALSPLSAWVLPAEPLLALIRTDHQVAMAVVQALSEDAQHQFDAVRVQFVNLGAPLLDHPQAGWRIIFEEQHFASFGRAQYRIAGQPRQRLVAQRLEVRQCAQQGKDSRVGHRVLTSRNGRS
jgi:CRP-like cAMP-binding protein